MTRRPCHAAFLTVLLALAPAAGLCAQEVLVSGWSSNEVHRYRLSDGTYLGPLATFTNPLGQAYGPDGNLYVAVEGPDQVVRFDPVTLANLGPFVWDDPSKPGDETGGLDNPTGVVFGADGHLVVASFNTDSLKKYDGATGAYLGDFVSSGSGGLNGPDAGIAFGPDGHLYVPSFWNHQVLRYDGTTGAFLNAFVPARGGGIVNPRQIVFRGDGMAYVTGEGSNAVHRYRPNGTFQDLFIRWDDPTGIVLNPWDGDVYLTSSSRNAVVQQDGTTGARVRTVVASGAGGLKAAVFLGLLPDAELRQGRVAPGQAGVSNRIDITNATPGTRLFLIVGTQPASIPMPGCPGRYLGIADINLVPLTADGQGSATVQGFLDPSLSGTDLRLQTVELLTCRVSNLVTQTLL